MDGGEGGDGNPAPGCPGPVRRIARDRRPDGAGWQESPSPHRPHSRTLVPRTAASSLGILLDLGEVGESEIYDAFDGLGSRRNAIETRLGMRARLGEKVSGDVVRLGSALDGLRRRRRAVGGDSAFLGRETARAEQAFAAATRKAGEHGIRIGRVAEAHRRFSKDLARGEAKRAVDPAVRGEGPEDGGETRHAAMPGVNGAAPDTGFAILPDGARDTVRFSRP